MRTNVNAFSIRSKFDPIRFLESFENFEKMMIHARFFLIWLGIKKSEMPTTIENYEQFDR